MRNIIYILILFPTLLNGQVYNKVVTPTDTFYKLNEYYIYYDSIPKGLPDGKYKVFISNNPEYLKYVFNLINNCVNGFFIEYNTAGNYWSSIGCYKDDSLWTFINGSGKESDSTFKVGNWEYYYCPGSTWDYVIRDYRAYKMEYNSDSLYIENWFYEDGNKLKESIYHERKGIIKQTFYLKNGDLSYFWHYRP